MTDPTRSPAPGGDPAPTHASPEDSWGEPVAPPRATDSLVGGLVPAAAPSGGTIFGAPDVPLDSVPVGPIAPETRPDAPVGRRDSGGPSTRPPAAFAGSDGPMGAVPGYRILRELASGGMGTVYEAEQERPRRIVALKVVKAGMASPEMIRRFDFEAQVLAKLRHRGIAQVFEAGSFDSGWGPQPFFAMEFIRGSTLLDYVREREPDLRARVSLLAEICDAVEHAHRKGVIHRDLKPGNIMVDEGGQPKILDFGLARASEPGTAESMHTQSGAIIGTPYYMSPEQAEGRVEDVDTRSDVFALGAIAFQTLTGRLPFDVEGKRVLDVVLAIIQDEPLALSSLDRRLRGDLDTIVRKALEKDRDRRYGSAGAMADDFRRYLADEAISARAPSVWYQVRKFSRRNKSLVGAVIAVFASLVLAVLGIGWQARRATLERDTALREREQAMRSRTLAEQARARADEKERQARRYLVAARGVASTAELARGNLDAARAALADVSDAEDPYISFLRAAANTPVVRDWFARPAPRTAMRGAVFVGESLVEWGLLPLQPSGARELRFSSPDDPGSGIEIADLESPISDVAPSWRPGFAVSTDLSGVLREWNVAERRSEREIWRSDVPLNAVAVSPDGSLAAVAGGPALAGRAPARVVLLETAKSKERTVAGAEGILGTVYDLAFSPDGTLLAVAFGYTTGAMNSAGGLALIDAAARKVVRVFEEDTNLLAVAWSPDGRMLVCGRSGPEAAVFDPVAGRVSLLPGHASHVVGVAFSPDGTLLATSGGNAVRPQDPGETILRRTDDWGALSTLSHEGVGCRRPAFSPDGGLLALPSSEFSSRLLEFAYGGMGRAVALPDFKPGAACYLPGSGKLLLSGARPEGKPVLVVASIVRGDRHEPIRLEPERSIPLDASVSRLAGDSSGRIAYATQGAHPGAPDGGVVRIDPDAGVCETLGNFRGVPRALAAGETSGLPYAGGKNGSVARVEPGGADWVEMFRFDEPVSALAVRESADRLAVVTRPDKAGIVAFRRKDAFDCTIWVGAARGTFAPAKLAGAPAGVSDIEFAPDGSRLVVASAEGLHMFDPESDAEPVPLGAGNFIPIGVDFTTDGASLLVAGSERYLAGTGKLEIRDTEFGVLKGRIAIPSGSVRWAQLDPGAGVLVLETEDHRLWIWKP